ncbi:response regulator transcription factor [Cyanobacterium aponinum]|uniref:Two component transcriptional regulator, LuxR family n=1 Tax=Cyanobacterium aponinum (strain PCC 10605) TaxID=755178 RepID=K9Z587_CYAAP|nr:response regulator transcription factor [Cyanobacterium aponinum]AFZ54346.1 two component transcriptional regulator, LuxR family [Cyanobacterium aponinum PCC 10605]
MLKILLVEDDELFRLGLSVRLQQETDLHIVAEAEDGETAVNLTNRHPLDLVLLDIGLPRMSGLEACYKIKSNHPKLAILALTSHSEPSLINRLIEVGIQGYCLKGIPAETLILAIRSVVAGASWWDSKATQEIQSAFTSPSNSILDALTEREREILTLMAQGKSNQEIAKMLYITSGTVRVHTHSMIQKLGVCDRTQAILLFQNLND